MVMCKQIKEILPLEQKPLEEPLTVENVMDGIVEIPDSHKEFYKILYTGNVNEQCSARKSYMIEGSSADVIFACSGGNLIPGKHLLPGLTVKSLTRSKTMISLLNRFDHCASDETIRRFDLGLEETLFKTKTLVSSQIIRKSNLSTVLTWSNFDFNIETPSGVNTIHDKYGVCYQNTLPQEQIQTSVYHQHTRYINFKQSKKNLSHQEKTPCRRPWVFKKAKIDTVFLS